ncbi:MAG TPA: hypothetical protein VL651_17515 [Bacteroidia bacterium]|jgi:hypothetical protein|nr:hypothetical protein [Bacteroidia bacterium]
MKRIALLLFVPLIFMGADSDTKCSSVSFSFAGTGFSVKGMCDTGMSYYSHFWPDMYTPQLISKYKDPNLHSICGRLTTADFDTMIEIHIKWPDYHIPTKDEILALKNDTVWTLNWLKGKKKNFDRASGTVIGKSFDITLELRNPTSEFLPDVDPLGFLCVTAISAVDSSTFSASGVFECTVHGSDFQPKRLRKGNFDLLFTPGL